MPPLPRLAALLAVPAFLCAIDATAQTAAEGHDRLSQSTSIVREGILWNDSFGDGEDRWKTGGITQGWVFPERRFTDSPLIPGRSSGVEIRARALVMTPENTAVPTPQPDDRPFAQFAALGAFLRSSDSPDPVGAGVSMGAEDRIGIEVGWQGDPLPLYDITEAIHDVTGTNQDGFDVVNDLDGEMLFTLDAGRTLRFHRSMGPTLDVELAPFVTTRIGTQEITARTGGDILFGSSLAGRTWNHDPAIGALISGGSIPRDGVEWTLWVGGDVGTVARDAFLDGGSDRSGPSVSRESVTARARAGAMVEYGAFAVSYSVNWLSREFKTQDEGQMIGAIALKYRF